MRRKPGNKNPVMQYKCDWCGNYTTSFVVNLEHKHFCRWQTPGFPPDKDCLEEYWQEKINVRKKEEERILAQKKIELRKKEKEKEVRAKHLKALEEYSQELNQKLRRQRYGI